MAVRHKRLANCVILDWTASNQTASVQVRLHIRSSVWLKENTSHKAFINKGSSTLLYGNFSSSTED